MNFREKKITVILMSCGICLVIFIVFYNIFGYGTRAEPDEVEEDFLLEPNVNEEPVAEEEIKVILVDIKGAVHNEDVFEAEDGMRIKDVIEMAGGFTEDANIKQVNLAQRVEDEMVIYVPRIGEDFEVEDSLSPESDEMISLNK